MRIGLLVVAVSLCAGCSAQPAATPQTSSQPKTATITMTSKSPEAIEHVQKGEMLFDNLRVDDARKEIEEALRLDPDFVLAHVYHGQTLPGADGLAELAKAAAAAGSLPESERALVQGMDAEARGDFAGARAAYETVARSAPDDFRGHYYLGARLLTAQRYAEAVEHLKKATEVKKDAGGAQNMLGYASLRQRDTAGAIAAFNGRAASSTGAEPAGLARRGAPRRRTFPEAEAAFRKALELSPQFWNAQQGLAYLKFTPGTGQVDRLADPGKSDSPASRRQDRARR